MEVVLTGTGCPIPDPGTAGPGVLVSTGDVHLQFDAGRATIMRLAALGLSSLDLDAVFLTHHHSDHLYGLTELMMSREFYMVHEPDPLTVVVPDGPLTEFMDHIYDNWHHDIEVRLEHTGMARANGSRLHPFPVPTDPEVVWTSDDGSVRVSAVTVHHEPVVPAVAYRVDGPQGAVVISGDTRVCAEVEAMSRGADVLVHEAFRTGFLSGTRAQRVSDYHADTAEIGPMAARAGVPTLVLTHLIPPPGLAPDPERARAAFRAEIEAGGYQGRVVVGEDLTRISVGS